MIRPLDYMHPEDKTALENLENVALFPQCVKAFLKLLPEQTLHGLNMASKVRLGPNQLPEIWNRLPPICEKLGIPEPELYLEMNPQPNAYTFGDSRVFIALTSGLVGSMEDDELTAVIAHECGHIACRHVLYQSMAQMLLAVGSSIFGPLAAVSYPVQLALLAWSRRSELSADRAAAVVSAGPNPVIDTMIRLSGGPAHLTAKIDRQEYMKQAEAYTKEVEDSWWNFVLQSTAILQSSHPFCAVRAREIDAWCRTEDFARILRAGTLPSEATCPACGGGIEGTWKFCRHCGSSLMPPGEE